MKPEKIVKLLFVCLVFVLIADPSDLIFHLKVPLFLLIFVGWMADKLITRNKIAFNRDILFVTGAFLLIPFLGLISAIYQQHIEDPVVASGIFKSFSLIVLLLIVIDYKMVTDKYLIWSCLLIPVIIISCYLLTLINIELFNLVYNYLNFEKDVAKFAIRNYFGYTVLMFFYKTSPLLVFPLSYFLNKYFSQKKARDLVFSAAFILTLFLSGTRANILAALIVFLYQFFKHHAAKPKKLSLIIYSFVFVFCIFYFISTLTFGQQETSERVKSGHLTSYITLFKEKPSVLIWGQGVGSRFYSLGFDDYVSQTELTYLDLIRIWGLPVSMLLMGLLIYPFFFLYSKDMPEQNRYAIVAYFAYLLIIGSNPLLISSTGFLVIITMYSFFNSLRHPVALAEKG